MTALIGWAVVLLGMLGMYRGEAVAPVVVSVVTGCTLIVLARLDQIDRRR